MKKLFALSLILLSASAFARITIHSNQSALQFLLDSKDLVEAKSDVSGELENASVSKIEDGGNKNFDIELTYSSDTPIGKRTCSIKAKVKSEIYKVPNLGVTTSRLVIDEIDAPLCQK